MSLSSIHPLDFYTLCHFFSITALFRSCFAVFFLPMNNRDRGEENNTVKQNIWTEPFEMSAIIWFSPQLYANLLYISHQNIFYTLCFFLIVFIIILYIFCFVQCSFHFTSSAPISSYSIFVVQIHFAWFWCWKKLYIFHIFYARNNLCDVTSLFLFHRMRQDLSSNCEINDKQRIWKMKNKRRKKRRRHTERKKEKIRSLQKSIMNRNLNKFLLNRTSWIYT